MALLDSLVSQTPTLIVSHWRTTKGVIKYGFDEQAAALLKSDIATLVAKYKPVGLVRIDFLVDLNDKTETGRSVGSLDAATAVLPKG